MESLPINILIELKYLSINNSLIIVFNKKILPLFYPQETKFEGILTSNYVVGWLIYVKRFAE